MPERCLGKSNEQCCNPWRVEVIILHSPKTRKGRSRGLDRACPSSRTRNHIAKQRRPQRGAEGVVQEDVAGRDSLQKPKKNNPGKFVDETRYI